MSSSFKYLVRFVDQDGNICYGNLTEEVSSAALVGMTVSLLTSDPIKGLKAVDEKEWVEKVLCPLDSTPIFQCIGVNYARHARETNFNVPSQPVVFTKPADSFAGPFDDIYCHPVARSQLDYEGELCFIFGRDCKDVSEEEALSCVLGYTVGNNISARNYIPQEVSGFQMSYGKSFDAFAPFGPFIVSPAVVGTTHNLRLVTRVNGEVRQAENTADMIWHISQIIVHLSSGRTVRAGIVCMTGTPSGVGWFMKPPGYDGDQDVMEVQIEKLGTLVNKIVFS
ncbi:hypothetical protein LTR93_011071 [Exophiala xenobiotica]|nr:hypothetical protein LTR93_011071 [Exophiala xenobiotica]